jgi:fucose permease
MQQNQEDQSNQEWDDEDEISLLDLALTVAENLKLLIFGSLGAGIVALTIALIWPNIYTGKATILPPGQDSTSASALLMSSIGGLGGSAGD